MPIAAKFDKPSPTKDGITYTLKGPKSKESIRAAADYYDEDCLIILASEMQITPRDVMLSEIRAQLERLNDNIEAQTKEVTDEG